MDKLHDTEMDELPSVRKVVQMLSDDVPTISSKTYQGARVVRFDETFIFFKSKYKCYIDSVLACLNARLKDSSADTTTLTHALKVLATHGWQKTEDASFASEVVQALSERFAVPLQEANANCFATTGVEKYGVLCQGVYDQEEGIYQTGTIGSESDKEY